MKGYDTIIVGAGSAGAILAARLTEDPDRSVLLLVEAGPDYRSVERLPDDVKWGYGDLTDATTMAIGERIAEFVKNGEVGIATDERQAGNLSSNDNVVPVL